MSFSGFSQSIATYTITFNSTWNANQHTSIPTGAHWSKLVGVNHNSNITFLEIGQMASSGIEMIAEQGINSVFRDVDVLNAINEGNAQQYINGSDLPATTGTITISNIEVNDNFPILTLLSMVAPSPDWLIAIKDIELKDNLGNWKSLIEIDEVFVYDSGTDNGTNYNSSNSDSNEPITIFKSPNNIAPFNGNSIGSLSINLVSVLSVSDFDETIQNIKLFPNPSKGIVNIDNATNLKSISIYNILGRKIIDYKFNNTAKVQLNLTDYSPGIYLLKFKDNLDNTISKKLILK